MLTTFFLTATAAITGIVKRSEVGGRKSKDRGGEEIKGRATIYTPAKVRKQKSQFAPSSFSPLWTSGSFLMRSDFKQRKSN